MSDPAGFHQTVFLNCPYDDEYRPLLGALLFSVLDCGLTPRLASDQADSGQPRLEKIRELIRDSRFSIHDISRMDPLQPGDLPRFNMPFELGLDLGCRFQLWERYIQFTGELETSLAKTGFTQDEIQALEVAELVEYAARWIGQNPSPL
jgi:hypothetical protein